ncbi:MAG: flagellar basal-body rod protein FlgF [Hyphomicrobiales bacterium]|nr:flagellar basal-body rod protein FlgF [Hyphomicrobiales bacterium]
MENALLISMSRQMALQRRMDVLANNMANVNTAGFKSDSLMFEEYLMPVARMNDVNGSPSRLSYVQDVAVYRDFAEGTVEQTGGELDVALSGDAWLVVDTPNGDRYTRNGQLKLDADGQLVTLDGFAVMGEGGPLTFTVDESGIEIARDGTISTSQGIKDQLRLVRFENNNLLSKEGSTLFSSEAAPIAAENAEVMQGMIEKSNVQPVIELTRIIETVRAYTSVTRTLQQTHDLRRDAIERLGSPNQA